MADIRLLLKTRGWNPVEKSDGTTVHLTYYKGEMEEQTTILLSIPYSETELEKKWFEFCDKTLIDHRDIISVAV